MNNQNTSDNKSQKVSLTKKKETEANEDNQYWCDSANKNFAEVLEKVTWIGILIMLIFGVLYLFGLYNFVEPKNVVANWGDSAKTFWYNLKEFHPNGYGWFLSELGTMDSLSLFGICLLALSPFVAILSALVKTREKVAVILLSILSLEFIFAIIRPLYLSAGGH